MQRTLHRALVDHLWLRWIAVLLVFATLGAAAIAEAAASPGGLIGQRLAVAVRSAPLFEERIVWDGVDADGDGAADFVNPTGQAPREHDDYGDGYFGASRDGGVRNHEGVDYAGDPGQAVVAPISGYVTKIGQAYDGASDVKFVEISNPALQFEARVFYVDPAVEVGDVIALGDVIGELADLSLRYPDGMTNHVHLEIKDQFGERFDATQVITARIEYVRTGA